MGELSKDDRRRIKMQAQLNVEFRRTLTRKYEVECKRNNIDPTLDGLLAFAEKNSLIRDMDINRYMVFDMYPAALYNNNGCKARAIAEIEDKVPVSDRIIFSWLQNLKRRYMSYWSGK